MTSCAIATCANHIKTRVPGTVFHRFPKDPTIQKCWIIKCCRQDGGNPKFGCICSEHFSADDYERDLMGELLGLQRPKKLRKVAVPSLNLPNSKQLNPSAIQRKQRMEEKASRRLNAQLLGS